MAITKSAKKAIRSSERKRVFNVRRKRQVGKALKGVQAVAGKAIDEQKEALRLAQKALDKAAKRGVIKKNTASRKKSRLSAALKKSSAK